MNSKQAAIAAAKQVARESNEFLKSAREQIAPSPEVPRQEAQHTESVPDTSQRDVSNKNLSFLAEYKNELQEIEHESLFKELLKKISEGEEVPVEDFAKELSWEQRDVLKARIEAVKVKKAKPASPHQASWQKP